MKQYVTAYAKREGCVVTVWQVTEPNRAGTVTKIGPSKFEARRHFGAKKTKVFESNPDLFLVDESLPFVAAAKWCVGGCNLVVQAPHDSEPIRTVPEIKINSSQ